MHAGSGSPTLESLLSGGDAAFVHDAYRLLLGREVDSDGLGNYLEQLSDGLPREQMLVSLALSHEGRVRAAAGRPGDPETLLREQVLAFAAPAAGTLEALLAHKDAAFVRCAYAALLGRDADVPGARDYLARLRDGASQWRILGALRASREYSACEAARRAVRDRDFGAQVPVLIDLLAQPEARFAVGAHLLITGRKPAPLELTAQLGRLRSGLPRAELLHELATGEAGRESRALLERLQSALRYQRLATLPIVGRGFAALFGLEGDSRAEMRMRRIENELHRLSGGSGRAADVALPPEPPSRPDPAASGAAVVVKPHARVAPRLVTLASTVGEWGREHAAR